MLLIYLGILGWVINKFIYSQVYIPIKVEKLTKIIPSYLSKIPEGGRYGKYH